MRNTGIRGYAVALVLVLLAGCASGRRPASDTTQPASSSAPSASTANLPYLVRRIHTGSKPCATLGAAGSIWVADLNDSVVKRIDPDTGRILASFPTAAGPCGMAYGAGSVWIEDYTASAVTRIELASKRVSTIAVGNLPYDVTFAAGAAWVTNYGDGTVTRIDPASNRTRTITVGSQPIGIAAAAGAIWVSDSGSQQLSRIDEVTGRVTSVPFGGRPSWTAFDSDTVRISDQSTGQVVRLDARTGRIVHRIPVGSTPNDPDVLDGAVWIPDKSGALYRLDLLTDAVTGPYPVAAGNPFVVAGYHHRLWIADYGGTDTIEVNPALLPG